jgi:predicted membrane protein
MRSEEVLINAQMRWFVGSNLIRGFGFEFKLVNMATIYLLRVGFVAQRDSEN